MAGELSSALGHYAETFKFDQLREADQAHLVDAFVNWVGCTVGGARVSSVDIAARAYRTFSPNGNQAVLGRQDRFGLIEAMSLDCLASAAWGFDDTHLETVLHPTGPVAAALLGEARVRTVSGRDYLSALHVGMEVECRVGLTFASEGTGARAGWYATGIAGGIGAAAGLAHLRGFNEAQVRNAMALAAARASGNRGTLAAMSAAYVPALGAESGFIAAGLAEAGFICGDRSLDGTNGLIDLMAPTPAYGRALAKLGSESEAAKTAFKPYPCGIVVHPIIDACLSLGKDHAIALDDILKLHFNISQNTSMLVARKRPKDFFEGQVSLYYWAAATLAGGEAGPRQLDDSMLADPALAAFQDRITVTVDPGIADDQCVATATLTDGRTIKVSIEHAKGSIDKPMTSGEIDDKFLTLAAYSSPPERAQQLLDTCRNVLALDDISRILAI